MTKKTICMLSDMHSLFDDRIYWKETISLKEAGYHLIHIGFSNEEKDYISKEGVQIITVKKNVFSHNIFIHKIIKTLFFDNPHKKMMRKIKEVKADAYHIHDLKVNKLGNKIKKLPWSPKVIYDIHEDYGDMLRYYHSKKGLQKKIINLYAFIIDYFEKKRTQNYDFYFPVTPYIRDKFRTANSNIQSSIVYNFTNLKNTFDGIKREKVYDLIYTGTINWTRGATEIVESIDIIRNKIPDIKMLFIGNFHTPEYEAYIKKEIESRNLGKNIHILPSVSYNEVYQYYQQSKIGLGIFHPIKIFTYAIQIKTFEYMMFGLPIICSNFGYINKFVLDSQSGIPVNPLVPAKIAEAAIELLTNKDRYNMLSKNGIKAAQTKYNWDSEAKKLISTYKKLLN